MHQPTLQANGFEVKEFASGQMALTSVPFSRFTVFGASDVQELLALLEQQGPSMGHQQAAGEWQAARGWGLDVLRPSR